MSATTTPSLLDAVASSRADASHVRLAFQVAHTAAAGHQSVQKPRLEAPWPQQETAIYQAAAGRIPP